MQSQFDGVAAPGYVGAFGGVLTPDSAFMDRVEVLQGAAGLLTGAGQPGGTINMIRKRPTETFQAQADVQLGSWNARRVVGDVSGPLVESGRIRGRLVALADNSDSFTDYVYRNRRAIYGIAEADLAPGTTLDASIQYQKDTGRNHFGVPFAADGRDAGLPRSFFASDAQNRSERDFTTYTLGLSQQLARDWRLKASYSRQEGGADRRYYSIFNTGALDVATGDGLTMRRMRDYDETTRSDVLDVQASGPFQLLGRRHELALGLNGAVNRKETAATGWASTSAVNIHTFDPEMLGEVPAGGSPSSSNAKTTQLGVYGVARWRLADSLRLITGVRVGNYENKNVLTGQVAPKETGVVTPYGGLIYDINAQYSAYVSYSDVFNPQTNKRADGSVLKPVVGANYEAGIKGELLDRRLNVSAAVFRLAQSNLAQRDDSIPVDPGNACGGTCYTAAGKVVSQGVDLGIQGQVGSGLNLAAGYTYTSAEYAAGTQKGQRYRTEQPRHSLRLAASYRLPGTGWTLGGNVAATSKAHLSSTSATDPWTIRQGGLVLLGLNAKYRIGPKTQVTLAVSNLTDRSYRSLYARNYSPFGEPRKFAVSLRHQF
jgi:outer membrane receptor for ferric coprogen and ferric-rhodotorulic acid